MRWWIYWVQKSDAKYPYTLCTWSMCLFPLLKLNHQQQSCSPRRNDVMVLLPVLGQENSSVMTGSFQFECQFKPQFSWGKISIPQLSTLASVSRLTGVQMRKRLLLMLWHQGGLQGCQEVSAPSASWSMALSVDLRSWAANSKYPYDFHQ